MANSIVFRELTDDGLVISYVPGLRRVKAPAFAQILNAQMHRGRIGIWMLVDESQPDVAYMFRIALTFPRDATLSAVPSNPGRHLGSIDIESTLTTVHVFEVGQRSLEAR